MKVFDFDITIGADKHQTNISINHINMEYIGKISMLHLKDSPGLQPRYKLSRRDVPVIHIEKGLLYHSDKVIFNHINLEGEYNDIIIELMGHWFKLNSEERTLQIINRDAKIETVEI